MREDEVVISREELRAVLEYSCSLPTGQTIGKRWRRATRYTDRQNTEWLIGEYVERPNPMNTIGIKWVWAVSAPGVPHRGDLNA